MDSASKKVRLEDVGTAPRPRTGARQTPTVPAIPAALERGAEGRSGNQRLTMKRNGTPKSTVCQRPLENSLDLRPLALIPEHWIGRNP